MGPHARVLPDWNAKMGRTWLPHLQQALRVHGSEDPLFFHLYYTNFKLKRPARHCKGVVGSATVPHENRAADYEDNEGG